jgi:hypothetical protein
MSEFEAITVLTEELVANTGFRARLQLGQELDGDAVQRTREALDTLATAWEGRECVPKEAVLSLTHLDMEIAMCIELYPELKQELENLDLDLMQRASNSLCGRLGLIEPDEIPRPDAARSQELLRQELIRTGRQMTEDEAADVVRTQFLAEVGFLLDLRMARGINREAIALVRNALATLRGAWVDRDCIPKDLAYTMIGVRTGILSNWDLYPNLHGELEALAEEMTERIRQCLR